MPRQLKLYIIGVVAAGALALVATTLLIPVDPQIGAGFTALGTASVPAALIFWTLVTLLASALPVRMPRGTMVTVSIAPLIATATLGGPTAVGWVALIGSTELRELRGRIPWYGAVTNHAALVIPAVAAGWTMLLLATPGMEPTDPSACAGAVRGAVVFVLVNAAITARLVSLRTGLDFSNVLVGDARGVAAGLVGLAPLGWLMAQMYAIAWWASLLFAVPLYTTRLAYHNSTEMREMFTQTITALAGAVDKRDPYTSKHSWR